MWDVVPWQQAPWYDDTGCLLPSPGTRLTSLQVGESPFRRRLDGLAHRSGKAEQGHRSDPGLQSHAKTEVAQTEPNMFLTGFAEVKLLLDARANPAAKDNFFRCSLFLTLKTGL